MKWLLGIDGGGSKTITYAADINGNVIGRLESGPLNYYSKGPDNIIINIENIINECSRNYNLDLEELVVVSIGLAGAGREEEAISIKKCLSKAGLKCKFIINSDALIALMAGLKKLEGIVLISGTGSIAYGIKPGGEVIRAGGWGHILGDEGSGYYIGREGLRRSLRSLEGMEKPTLLMEELLKSLNINNLEQLVKYIYSKDRTKKEIAALAPVIVKCAEKGDELARDILIDAGRELVSLVESVIKRGFSDCQKIDVVLYGGILQKVDLVRQYVVEKVKDTAVILSDREPAHGAVLIGLQHLKDY